MDRHEAGNNWSALVWGVLLTSAFRLKAAPAAGESRPPVLWVVPSGVATLLSARRIRRHDVASFDLQVIANENIVQPVRSVLGQPAAFVETLEH